METQIQTYVQVNNQTHLLTFFGYSTKGLPGIEINGLGLLGKMIKEKINFLSRSRKLKIPIRRYIICFENFEGIDLKNNKEITTHLELPILFLYWHMAKLIPISNLEDCLVAGSFSSRGDIIHAPLPTNLEARLATKWPQASSFIKLIYPAETGYKWIIYSDKLLASIPKLYFS